MKQLFILTLLTFSLIACNKEKTDPTANWDALRLYNEAKLAMDSANFSTAIDYLESLESRYPFGKYATQAQLDVIYAYYQYNELDSTVAAADRFIKLNPRHPNVDYAYYIKGLANFNRGGTILDKLQERDFSQFDPNILQQSFNDLSTLVTLFPESRYAADTQQRLIFLRNQMARAQLNIANYYVSRGAWTAAANRAKQILIQYQGSEVVKQALEVQLLSYQKLELNDLAEDVQRIIDINYKNES
ncbi:MAG: outer membrane protein assembly factor BamD [Gammaproteobacteria bacterium]|nr:outer membrane protein assembly factor BamD [Gammaproteobacteria bacterium]